MDLCLILFVVSCVAIQLSEGNKRYDTIQMQDLGVEVHYYKQYGYHAANGANREQSAPKTWRECITECVRKKDKCTGVNTDAGLRYKTNSGLNRPFDRDPFSSGKCTLITAAYGEDELIEDKTLDNFKIGKRVQAKTPASSSGSGVTFTIGSSDDEE